jgi:hypothetical protein
VITRILRQRGSLLLAAKLLLLSRLTHKTLSQHAEAPPLVDNLRDRLASLRVKLLLAIDKRFADPERQINKLVDDMCAFSLATSSTPSDVLQHFLKIRLRAIQWHLEQDEDIKSHAIKAMHLLLNTLRNSQTIFPKRLSDSLVRLKDLPLIRQADVQSVVELQLSTHARWLADELKNYTPWPRHDELQKPEADRILRAWAKGTQKAFVAGLQRALHNVVGFEDVLAVRQHLFQAWPWNDNRLPGLRSADVVDELREAFNDRLTAIIRAQVSDLSMVCKSARGFITSSILAKSELSLWDSSLITLDIGAGGHQFKNAILTSYNSIDSSSSPPIQSFDKWITGVKQIQADLKQMKDAHWDEDFGDDEDEMDSRRTLLSEDDPRALGDCLTAALNSESGTMLKDFHSLILDMNADADTGRQAITLLRVLREISKRAVVQDKLLADVSLSLTTSRDIIQPLHASIASATSIKSEVLLTKSLTRFSKNQFVIERALWEGKPPLPAQPSAMTFKFLKTVTAEMAELGADLWSEAAVTGLKKVLTDLVVSLVRNAVQAIADAVDSAPRTNGTKSHAEDDVSNGETNSEDTATGNGDHDEPTEGSSQNTQISKEKLTQLVMDLNYLDAALGSTKQGPSLLQRLIDQAVTGAGLGEAEQARLHKSATDYWKRTYLLFALLTPS